MQFVNDDMDDELFRHAAEEYPLKTDSGDWNKVLKKMEDGGNDNISGKKGNNRKYLLLLALIPLLLICTTYIKNDSVTAENNVENGRKVAAYPITKKRTKEVQPTSLTSVEILNQQEQKDEMHKSISSEKTKLFFGGSGSERNDHLITAGNEKEKIAQPFIDQGTNVSLEVSGNKTVNGDISTEKIGSTAADNKVPGEVNADQTSSIISRENKTVTGQPQAAVEPPKESLASVNKKEKHEKTGKKLFDRFYVGFQGGPDFSMVKSSDINGTGYSFGLLAGFNINKKLALETGLLWDRKKYQSKGKYFDTQKLDWPHVTILNLSGYCDMYEIPLNLRFNVSSNSKRTLFVNAGVSSYLMKMENYDYHFERYGVYGNGNKGYKNTTNNWLSVAHLSLGLQKKLGNIGDLRIEPYVKLPINGVGIGSMPIKSTGIYLGITRPIR